ncbi:MAG: hypothetical protein MR616_09370 [Pyramidobacter sp.]|nr:hypothetical protein [Pyramidobacter sp.]
MSIGSPAFVGLCRRGSLPGAPPVHYMMSGVVWEWGSGTGDVPRAEKRPVKAQAAAFFALE